MRLINKDALFKAANEKFYSQFGFNMKDTSLSKIVNYMYKPKDSSSLAVTRFFFGFAMLFDIPDERGGLTMERRWGNPNTCHFPLLPFLQVMPMRYMAFVYVFLWIGAFGIMLGYMYRFNSIMFCVCYWYLFLIEKSYWNNHSYLFGLVALLLTFTKANCYWSIDALHDKSIKSTTVPYWNYFIIKYQFFILYFMAGMKKGTTEWLTGYSLQNLSDHWVFTPFRLFLTGPQTDYLVVHWFVFIFDLTVSIWMMYSKTRHVAMVFCALFHLMNSRLFSIGMFPWVCLATMPLFYPFDWPKILLRKFGLYCTKAKTEITKTKYATNTASETGDVQLLEEKDSDDFNKDLKPVQETKKLREEGAEEDHVIHSDTKVTKESKKNIIKTMKNENLTDHGGRNKKKRLTVYLIFFYVVTQAFLPYSHFITKGYNNWTNGLYGYSWDMMVHTWDTYIVTVKLVDNENNSEFYIDPYKYTPNERWARHGDMVYQYAKCIKGTINREVKARRGPDQQISVNLSIYVEVWCSLNGRFAQRLFDSKVDILKADWSPFRRISYLMPLLDESLYWRNQIAGLRTHAQTLPNFSHVQFYAEFPGYEQEQFISANLTNVTLTVLEGSLAYEPQVTDVFEGHSHKLSTGDTIKVEKGMLHKVLNTGEIPAYYMYTYFNETLANSSKGSVVRPKLPIATELYNRFSKIVLFGKYLATRVYQIFNAKASTCYNN